MKAAIVSAMVVVVGLGAGCGKSERAAPRNRELAALAQRCGKDAELSCPRPVFTAGDLRSSQRYYRDALGFKLDWDYGDPPTFGSVSRAESQLFLCQGCSAPRGAAVMIFARDVDRLHEELARKGAIIKQPPKDMPWGMREMVVADPDGNTIVFGSSIEH